MKFTNHRLKKMYQDAIFQVFGIQDPDPLFKASNKRLKRSIKQDVRISSNEATTFDDFLDVSSLTIYCEGEIPNATDVHDFSAELAEFGFTGSAVQYNSDKWSKVDGLVNLLAEAYGWHERFYHEPHSSAMIVINQTPPF